MKLKEMVSPAKVAPGESEQEARRNIAKQMFNIIASANQGKIEHNKIFHLAKKATGDDNFLDDVHEIELKRDDNIRRSRTEQIAKSPLNLVELNSILKQMEQVIRK